MGAAALFEAMIGRWPIQVGRTKGERSWQPKHATDLRGGLWLVSDTTERLLTRTPHRRPPPDLATAHEFMTNEVLPAIERLEQKDWALARDLVARAGALGLLGTDVPEQFGGVDLDKAASILVGEAVGRSASYATTIGAETGLAIFPLLSFGTDAQKQQFLPRLAVRRDRRRLCAQRVRVRLRRAVSARARDTAAGRLLRPQRREDVDHQRRLRRRLHRLCQGGRRAVLGLHRRTRLRRRHERQGGAQDGAARLLDHAADPAGRACAGRQPARRDRQGASRRAQHLELRTLQARRRCAPAAPRW